MKKEIITSKQNNKVKALVKLREKRLLREEIGQFLIEGYKELSEALVAGVKIIEIYYCPKLFNNKEFHDLLREAEASGTFLQEVNKDVFGKVSHREGPDGLLGIGEAWSRSLNDIKLSKNPLLIIIEGIEKPGNLGNIIRSAEAVGVDMLVVSESSVDIFNPNVVRASRGMVFSLPIVVCKNDEIFEFLQKHKIFSVAMTPHTETIYWDLDMSGPTAIIVGNEKNGLSNFWMNKISVYRAKIPLEKQGDALNVSIAGVLALYESLRQRR